MTSSFLADIRKVLIGAAAGAAIVFAFNWGKTEPSCPRIEPTEHIVKKQEKTTVTKKPDGTVVTETIKDKTETKVIPTKTDKIVVRRPAYSADLMYLPSLTEAPKPTDLEILLGARIGQTPLSVTGGYDVKHNQFSVGVRYEW